MLVGRRIEHPDGDFAWFALGAVGRVGHVDQNALRIDAIVELGDLNVLMDETRPQRLGVAIAEHAGHPDAAGDDGADVTYLQNGPLVLAVHRVGLGARIERSLLEHISLRVDASSFTRIKGLALMRGYEVIGQSETDFAFRDPLNVVWDLNLAGNPVFASPFQ